jgi:hypothetical protein
MIAGGYVTDADQIRYGNMYAMATARDEQKIAREAVSLAGMFVLPGEFAVKRVPLGWNPAPTAVARTYNYPKINWNPQSTATPQIPVTDFFAAGFREPCRTLVYHNQTTVVPFTYTAVFDPTGTGENQAVNNQFLSFAQEATPLKPIYFVPVNSNAPHGAQLYCGYDKKRNGYFFVNGSSPGNFKTSNAGTGAPATITVTITYYDQNDNVVNNGNSPNQWAGTLWLYTPSGPRIPTFESGTTPGEVFGSGGVGNPSGALSSNATQPTITWTVNQTGYYSIDLAPTAGPLGSNTPNTYPAGTQKAVAQISMTTTNPSVFIHLSMGQLFTNIQSVEGITLPALSWFLQNEASPLNRQGNIVVAQADAYTDWYWSYAYQQPSPYTAISQLSQMEQLLLADGLYSFLKPDDIKNFSEMDRIKKGGGQLGANLVQDTTFSLINESEYWVLACSCTGQFAGDVTLMARVDTEFRTQNQWMDTIPPDMNNKSLELAMHGVSTMRQHYPNSVHRGQILKNIFGTLGKIGRASEKAIIAFRPFLPEDWQGVADAAHAVAKGVGNMAEFYEPSKDPVRQPGE